MTDLKRLAQPEPADVETDSDGRPVSLDTRPVEEIREEWLVEDRWWDTLPIRRHYFELLLTGGHVATIYLDLTNSTWHRQQA